jgi:hypothetical protein
VGDFVSHQARPFAKRPLPPPQRSRSRQPALRPLRSAL